MHQLIALAPAVIFLVVLWFIWQVYVSQGLFDWLGDRIDNLTDDSNASVLPVDPREAVVTDVH